jgi:hypothetical protein
MIEFKTDSKPRIALTLTDKVELTFTTTKSVLRALEELNDKPITVTIKEYRKKRSLSQNAYLWVLLDQVAAKVNRSKEDIYKIYIKDYGVFEPLPIRNDAVDRFINNWSKNGLGWFCEDLGESKLDGYTKLIAYYGSSTYTTAELKRVLDAVILDCEELGIQTMPLSDFMLLQNDND